ncbi:methionine synthase [Anaerovibrio sp.]|uniref:methionine synthase n=1 Tax=Anaerovibrio sp. TaxID=1872532 RepID=UPI003F14431E
MPIYNSPVFSIDATETRRYAGLQKADFSQQLIDEACLEAQLLIRPKGSWHIYDYDADRQLLHAHTETCTARRAAPEELQMASLTAVNSLTLQGDSIGGHLRDCCQVIVMAATVGEAIENQVTKCFEEGRYSFSVLLDAAATAAVEQVADAMEKTIHNEVKRQGLAMKWRFSPGYGDWPIQQQTDILRLAQGADIGISLSESLMLMPRKSITAVIGLYYPAAKPDCNASDEGQDDEGGAIPAGKKHDCSRCDKLDCPARIETQHSVASS